MPTGPEYLAQVTSDLAEGRASPRPTVRELLSMFGAQRRGYWIVSAIRRELTAKGLATNPDFEAAYIDSPIEFALRTELPDESGEEAQVPAAEIAVAVDMGGTVPAIPYADPAYRVSKLEAANRSPVRVTPDADLSAATTLMLSNSYSQLPVMTSDREVKGVISWSSIGSRLALGRQGTKVREFMDQHHEIRADASIFTAINTIVEHDYVLVRATDMKISGIVTASDLSLQFRGLSEPFLLLSEIENHIRGLLADKFTANDLAAAKDTSDPDRNIDSVADLTFGEYLRLLQHKERWQKLGLAIDRVVFCTDLDEIRRIRNDVMHFDPDGVTDQDLRKLRDFASFLNRLQTLANQAA